MEIVGNWWNCGNWDSVIVKFVKCWNVPAQSIQKYIKRLWSRTLFRPSQLRSPIVWSLEPIASWNSKIYWCLINVHCLKSKIVPKLCWNWANIEPAYLMVQSKLLEVYAHLIILFASFAILLIAGPTKHTENPRIIWKGTNLSFLSHFSQKSSQSGAIFIRFGKIRVKSVITEIRSLLFCHFFFSFLERTLMKI